MFIQDNWALISCMYVKDVWYNRYHFQHLTDNFNKNVLLYLTSVSLAWYHFKKNIACCDNKQMKHWNLANFWQGAAALVLLLVEGDSRKEYWFNESFCEVISADRPLLWPVTGNLFHSLGAQRNLLDSSLLLQICSPCLFVQITDWRTKTLSRLELCDQYECNIPRFVLLM